MTDKSQRDSEVSKLSLRFSAVRLRAHTSSGTYGFDATFADDVVVIRGGNTVGKSLLVQAILYGLGLDDLFAARQGTLTRAMTTELDTDRGRAPVVESEVWLEVSTPAGTITTHRLVKPGPERESNAHQLVTVWHHAKLTAGSAPTRDDPDYYFVNRKGGAAEDRGFHSFLSTFLGLQLPNVPNYSDSETRLYIQLLFALCYVDQKHGWGGTAPQMPTKYGIIEPLRRSVEYALALESLEKLTDRRSLDESIRALEAKEGRLRGRLEAAGSINGARVNFPRIPSRSLRSASAVSDQYDASAAPVFEVLNSGAWLRLPERIAQLAQNRVDRARIAAESANASAALGASRSPELERRLGEAQAAAASASLQLRELNTAETMLDTQMGTLARRLVRIDEELSRYSQLHVLADLGAQIAPSSLHDGDCPTCHQSLLGVESPDDGDVLSVSETIAVLKNERDTVRQLIGQAELAVAQIDPRRTAVSAALSDLRGQIRAIQNDLVAPDSFPSTADLQLALSEEALEGRLRSLYETTSADVLEWRATVTAYVSALLARLALGDPAMSESDERKIGSWTDLLRRDLSSFGFESAAPHEVAIDEAMRPTVDGYDISFQNSASDGIRLRWAYLLSLLDIARAVGDRHPGFLIFDEPGQQGVEPASLAALAARVSATAQRSQVFLTTSEPLEVLEKWFGETGVGIIDLGDERLLRPLSETGGHGQGPTA